MTRDELLASIVAAHPDRDAVLYIERRGDTYDWRLVQTGESGSVAVSTAPDVWMSFSAAWPFDEPDRLPAFFDDLLAELESMADTADRCRWPLDEPWPHHH
ncbi:hypothetical protein MSM1_01160 [Mycobacterium sp. SM1]|uniref:hypothetical protein n=1 Tax=Mycobacterium sp. SM1 TaxID=2816243 RepID=UPI001BD0BA28|nr:hypothetical protein [Mycobacterium sp. SM1]MBS4727034.1 hypothetical protein [Mycobacterium sp. SM1]